MRLVFTSIITVAAASSGHESVLEREGASLLQLHKSADDTDTELDCFSGKCKTPVPTTVPKKTTAAAYIKPKPTTVPTTVPPTTPAPPTAEEVCTDASTLRFADGTTTEGGNFDADFLGTVQTDAQCGSASKWTKVAKNNAGNWLDLCITDASQEAEYIDKNFDKFQRNYVEEKKDWLGRRQEVEVKDPDTGMNTEGVAAIRMFNKAGKFVFKWQFVQTGTSTPEALDFFPLTFYDIDGLLTSKERTDDKHMEILRTCDAAGVIHKNGAADGTEEIVQGNCVTHKSLDKEVTSPDLSKHLTQEQKSVSVSYMFKGVHTFHIEMEVMKRGRMFAFDGSKEVAQCE